MKTMFAVIICKTANFTSRFGVSNLGGYLALKLHKNILKKIIYPKYVIGILGSVDKNTTVELIAHIFNKYNYSFIYKKVSNRKTLVSLILDNSSLKGIFMKDVLIIELDEMSFYELSDDLKLTHLIITNITKDDFISEEVRKKINPECQLILNSDDPFVKKVNLNHKGTITYYGTDKSKNNYFKIEKPDYFAHNINLNNRIMFINDNKVNLPTPFLYSVYSVLAAYSLAKVINLDNEKILYALNEDVIKTENLNISCLGKRKWQMISSNNENGLNFKNSLNFINQNSGYKTIILGFENTSKKYTENDISWMWNIDFELLKNKNINKIILIGRFRHDVLVRMIYTGIKKDKIIILDDISNMLETLTRKTKGSIYSIVCLDMEITLKGHLKNETNENQNCSLVL